MATHDDNERFDEQGVDLTLVRYTLGLTPTERLKALENFMNAMASVKPSGSALGVPRPTPCNEPSCEMTLASGEQRPENE